MTLCEMFVEEKGEEDTGAVERPWAQPRIEGSKQTGLVKLPNLIFAASKTLKCEEVKRKVKR